MTEKRRHGGPSTLAPRPRSLLLWGPQQPQELYLRDGGSRGKEGNLRISRNDKGARELKAGADTSKSLRGLSQGAGSSGSSRTGGGGLASGQCPSHSLQDLDVPGVSDGALPPLHASPGSCHLCVARPSSKNKLVLTSASSPGRAPRAEFSRVEASRTNRLKRPL